MVERSQHDGLLKDKGRTMVQQQAGSRIPTARSRGAVAKTTAESELCHDMREPVGAIMLLASVAEMEVPGNESVRRRMRQITSEAKWLATLIDSQLCGDSARPVDVRTTVHDCVQRVVLASSADITVTSDDGVTASAAPVQLARALTNVVANAARAAGPDGRVDVRVTDLGDAVSVEVVDNGPGLGRLPRGHGLGLGITRKALASFGGDIELSPVEGGGTSVRMNLPSAAPQATAGPRPVGSRRRSGGRAPGT